MATAEQIKALIRSHFEGEAERFFTLSLQIAAHEAKTGHPTMAHDIRTYVDRARKRYGHLPGLSMSRDLSEMLLETKPCERLSDLVVPFPLRQRLDRIIEEYRHRGKLKQHGMANRRRLLLAGPPGTGKTMTASALAGELHLPLHTIMMHRIVTKFMGETSAKLRQIFDVIQEEPGVYLFDEFDAIGTQRGREHEVGEMRRVLNSFLQFIEHDDSNSMIIAATNTFEVLDTALFRRFDDVLYYQLPEPNERTKLMEDRLCGFVSKKINLESLGIEAQDLSHAEITRACDDAIKQILLTRKKKIDKKLLVGMLEHRREIYSKNGV
ncbi:MAG TPA: ATP-binding protein [Phycisphaerae bacterium]|nr:ATP-binding protein [Phycisphaerae bacterium]